MDELLKLSGLLNEDAKMESFADKRFAGAKKIADNAHEKGGVALLTYNHFKVKLPYYKKAIEGKLNFSEVKKEYSKLCSELHSHMKNIEDMNQTHFQELVGKIEVLGELLIRNKNNG
jgi:Cdc6-like AAA superfamily ATPase